MASHLFPAAVLILGTCIILPFLQPFGTLNVDPTASGIAFYLLVATFAGFVGTRLLGTRRYYFFVCGECDRAFLSERNLRTHFVSDHVKNGPQGSTG